MDYIRNYYDMPFLKRGMKIQYLDGGVKDGVITGTDGPYLRIRLDGEKESRNYHPCYMLRFFDEKGELIEEILN